MLLIFVFIGMVVISFALVAFFTRQTQWEKAVKQRVGDIQQARHEDRTRQQDAERILKADAEGGYFWLDRFFEGYEFTAKFKTLALQSGTDWKISSFLVYSLSAGAIVFLAGYFFFPALLLDVLVGIAALCAPYMYLKHRRNSRLQQFNNALPD